MATNYPGALDTTTQLKNNWANADVTDTVHPAGHNNISDALIAIETELGTNPSLAASSVSVLNVALMNRWIPVFEGSIPLVASASGASIYVASTGATGSVTATTAAHNIVSQYIDPADYAITGFTVQTRLVCNFQQNAVANGATSVTTVGLYPIVPAGATTVWAPTNGALVAGMTAAQTGGAAASDNKVVSAAITMPAADSYTFGAVVSVATRAGGGRINCRLEYRYV
jgi:hypothetical protein